MTPFALVGGYDDLLKSLGMNPAWIHTRGDNIGLRCLGALPGKGGIKSRTVEIVAAAGIEDFKMGRRIDFHILNDAVEYRIACGIYLSGILTIENSLSRRYMALIQLESNLHSRPLVVRATRQQNRGQGREYRQNSDSHFVFSQSQLPISLS